MTARPYLSGFTIARNVLRMDYPFQESIRSLLPLCDELVINVGDSNDGTLELCEELAREESRVRLLHSVWETQNQAGGQQLRLQTDKALEACRGSWGFYLQADEVLHEDDYGSLREAVRRASEDESIDALVFDYLHFYGNFSHLIRGRQCYRREVRAFKLDRDIRSFRDAQGFRRPGEQRLRAMAAGARVFHYGHVRRGNTHGNKASELSQWWGEDAAKNAHRLKPRRHVGLCPFEGTHPKVMAARLAENDQYWDPMQCERAWDWLEVKNLLTIAWESVVPYRIGEFRNYELRR